MATRLGKLRGHLVFAGNCIQQTWAEIRRAPCLYSVGLTATFLTVLIAAVVQTLLARSPLIFLREAETSRGQGLDVRITPISDSGNGYLNYSQFAASLATASSAARFENHAPRLSLYVGELYSVRACTENAASLGPAAAAALDAWASNPVGSCAANAGYWVANASRTPAAAPGSGNPAGWMYRLPAPLNASEALSDSGRPTPSPVPSAEDGMGPHCGPRSCLSSWCTARGPFSPGGARQPLRWQKLLLVDNAREVSAGIGRGFGATLRGGSVAINAATANKLGVSQGDTLVARLSYTAQIVRHVLSPVRNGGAGDLAGGGGSGGGGSSAAAAAAGAAPPPPLDAGGWHERSLAYGWEVSLPLTVGLVSNDATFGGKLPSNIARAGYTLLGDYSTFFGHVAAHLHPAIACGGCGSTSSGNCTGAYAGVGSAGPAGAGMVSVGVSPNGTAVGAGGEGIATLRLQTLPYASATGGDPYSFAGEIVAALAPTDRVGAYSASNYDRVRASIASYGSSLLFAAGFSESDVELP